MNYKQPLYRIKAILIWSAVASLLTGCSFFSKKINAYERQYLSLPGMELIENPKEETSMQHMFNAREGSVGGFGGAGGGCGCN